MRRAGVMELRRSFASTQQVSPQVAYLSMVRQAPRRASAADRLSATWTPPWRRTGSGDLGHTGVADRRLAR